MPKLTYLQELDLWIEDGVIFPLWDTAKTDKRWPEVVNGVYDTIHTLVLKAFREGQKAGPKGKLPESSIRF